MMDINSDINVLGSIADWDIIKYLWEAKKSQESDYRNFASIKTLKSIKRFVKALENTCLHFKNSNIEKLFSSIIDKGINKNTLFFVFLNSSYNNELISYINEQVYFPALYSGRMGISVKEVVSCIQDLRIREEKLKKWSDSTINTTASKYLTLLKKLSLLEGSKHKKMVRIFLDVNMLVLFVYWLVEVSERNNLLESPWLKYGFMEKDVLIERIKKNEFRSFLDIYYTGDKLIIEPKIEYDKIYDIIGGN